MPFNARESLLKFKQQQLKAWQPILTPKPVILTFVIVGAIFLIVGIVLLIESRAVNELEVDYSSLCNTTQRCRVTLNVGDGFSGAGSTIFVYYKLSNFYQNHRRYVKSRSDEQLRGDSVKFANTVDCDPKRTVDDSSEESKLLLPCGLIAASQFNDTFTLYKSSNLTLDNVIPWQKQGIEWEKDRERKFKNPSANATGVRVVADFQDEDFIVWMRTAGLPTFRKLYRKINFPLSEGSYTLDIQNNFPVAEFDGTKSIVLSTTTWIGGRNDFLGIAYIVVGVLCLVQGIGFAIKHAVDPRSLGDTAYLEGDK